MTHNVATIGILALQGAFIEHEKLLRQIQAQGGFCFQVKQVRTPEDLASCDALIIPGGESTSMAILAEISGLVDPLRHFIRVERKPTFGTCAGMILLAEQANRVKAGGQVLLGGLDIRVNRNHFGSQVDSFETDLNLKFLAPDDPPFHCLFIRAPIVEKILTDSGPDNFINAAVLTSEQFGENCSHNKEKVQILAELPKGLNLEHVADHTSKIVAVQQGNVIGASFHPELTEDTRFHLYFLQHVVFPYLSKIAKPRKAVAH